MAPGRGRPIQGPAWAMALGLSVKASFHSPTKARPLSAKVWKPTGDSKGRAPRPVSMGRRYSCREGCDVTAAGLSQTLGCVLQP